MEADSYHIDLNEVKGDLLNENMYTQFGAIVKMWLQTLLGGRPFHTAPKFRISGAKGDINSFMKTIGSQSKYIKAATALGLDDPRTFMNRSKFETALRNFERQTGIRWPVR